MDDYRVLVGLDVCLRATWRGRVHIVEGRLVRCRDEMIQLCLDISRCRGHGDREMCTWVLSANTSCAVALSTWSGGVHWPF